MAHSPLDNSLTALLKRHNIPQLIQDKMRDLDCNTVPVFSEFVEKKEDLKAALLAGGASENDAAVFSRLKLCWRQAEANTERGIKRSADGLAEECFDEPLDIGVTADINLAFKKAYGWKKLDLDRIVSDPLFGRIFREFQSVKITLLPITRVKTAALAPHKDTSTRRKLGEDLAIIFAKAPEDEEAACGSLLVYCELLEVLCNSWALAGIHLTEYKGLPVHYVYWPDACDYLYHIRTNASLLLLAHTESSVLTYAMSVEETFRQKAIALARGDEAVPFGQALKIVIDKYGNVWDSKKELLVKRTRRDPDSSGPTGSGKNAGGKGGKSDNSGKGGKNSSSGKSDKAAYRMFEVYAWDKKNNKICRDYNDQRGCANQCPKREVHCCDIVLLNGNQICGSRSHCRTSHNPARDGAPKLRR